MSSSHCSIQIGRSAKTTSLHSRRATTSPKLVFARNSIEEFLARSNDFAAHVSVMLEQFMVHSARRPSRRHAARLYVAGLLQEPEVHSEASTSLFTWQKGLNPRASTIADESEKRLVRRCRWRPEHSGSSDAWRRSSRRSAPLLAMQLDSSRAGTAETGTCCERLGPHGRPKSGARVLRQPVSCQRSGVLLDFAPEYLQQDRLRLMLTTRSTFELESIFRPAVESFGLKLPKHGEVAALEALRSLSGRLALRFMSSATQTAEVLALLLAVGSSRRSTCFRTESSFPSMHTGRGSQTPANASQQRADLLLVSFDPKTKTVFGKVVGGETTRGNCGRRALGSFMKMREQSETLLRYWRLASRSRPLPSSCRSSLCAKEL